MKIELTEGDDVTEALGIKKWDPEINDPAPRNISHKNPIINYMLRFKWFRDRMFPPPTPWPSWAPHSDETHIQALGEQWLHDNFDAEKHGLSYATIKKDGQSATYAFVDNEFWVCSRKNVIFKGKNTKKMKIGSTWTRVCAQEGIVRKLLEYAERIPRECMKRSGITKGDGLFIQGEICGPGIQGNKYHYEHLKFSVFNIGIVRGGKLHGFVDFPEFESLCYSLALDSVPMFDRSLSIDTNTTIDSLVELSKQTDPDYDTPIEGLVIRPWLSRVGDGLSGPVLGFKVINPLFLLKHDL